MNVLLINPDFTKGTGRDLYSGDILSAIIKCKPFSRMYSGFPLSLPTLAAVTPKEHDVKIIDESVENIDFDQDCDVVGLTAMTFKSTRAYEIAKEFRNRGKTTILGGIHASMMPNEALKHVDCIVKGEVEEIWPTVLEDISNGKLKPVYKADKVPDISKIPPPRYDLVKLENYSLIFLQTSRGCPYDCEFCTVTRMNGRKMRFKSPEQVVAEIDQTIKTLNYAGIPVIDRIDNQEKQWYAEFFFTDDNFAINRKHALAVCKAMTQYQKETGNVFSWNTQVNHKVGLDDELLQAFREAGCDGIFIGFESLDPEALKAMNKRMNSPEAYGEVFRNTRKYGIDCVFSMIIGGDFDTPATADSVIDFIEENNVFHTLPNILTPYPGTHLHRAMVADGRIIDENFVNYNIRNAVFEPKKMTPFELQKAYTDLCSRAFDLKGMIKRSKNGFLQNAHENSRFILPMKARIIVVFLYSFTTLLLCLRGKLELKVLWPFISNLTRNLISHGTFADASYMAWILDYNAFATSEKKRLAKLIKKVEIINEMENSTTTANAETCVA